MRTMAKHNTKEHLNERGAGTGSPVRSSTSEELVHMLTRMIQVKVRMQTSTRYPTRMPHMKEVWVVLLEWLSWIPLIDVRRDVCSLPSSKQQEKIVSPQILKMEASARHQLWSCGQSKSSQAYMREYQRRILS